MRERILVSGFLSVLIRSFLVLLLISGASSILFAGSTQAQDKIERRDTDGDGKPDQVAHLDRHGHLIRLEVDSNGDGRPDTWFYYKDGRIVRLSEDRNGDGRPDLWEIYDSSERLAMRKEDVDFDGVADIEKRF